MASATDPTTAALLAGLDLNATLGADFVGFAASAIVYGILTAQTYTYFSRFPLDKAPYKLLVLTLWLLETVDQAFIGHQFYYYSISNYGNPTVLLKPVVWSLTLQVAFGAVVGTIVKTLFGLRVWRFSNHNPFITGLILIMTLTQMGTATAFTIETFGLNSLMKLSTIKGIGITSLALGVANDFVTAMALCYFLNRLKTGYSNSDSLVNSLTLYAVNTGVLTSAFSLATLILYNIMPDNFIFMACYFIVSKLYAISLLATLNTRRVVRGAGTDRERSTGQTFAMLTNPRSMTMSQPRDEEEGGKKIGGDIADWQEQRRTHYVGAVPA